MRITTKAVWDSIEDFVSKKAARVRESYEHSGPVAKAMPFLVPIIAAIAAFTGLSVAIVTSLAISVGLTLASLGVSLITRLVTGKPSTNSSMQPVTSQASVRQPLSYWRVLYGRVQIGGIYTFINAVSTSDGVDATHPIGNNWLEMVFTLTGHKVHAINGIYFENVLQSFQNVNMVSELSLGDPNNTAQPFPKLVTRSNGLWNANCKQQGRAAVHLGLRWDANAFPNGLPSTISFDVSGKECYDPRTGLTQWTDNPALCILDYLLSTSYGMKVPLTQIDTASFIAAANICDETILTRAANGGAPEKRYTMNGCFDVSGSRADVLRSMLLSMCGYLVPPGDKWRIYAGAYRSPTVTLTDDDIRDTLQVQMRTSRSDLFNNIQGTYISPLNQWQPSDYPFQPPSTNTMYSDEDGEVIWEDLQLDFTTSPTMAQRIARITLERSRRQVTFTAPCKLTAYQVQAGDVVEFSHPRFGWVNKTFEVLQVDLVPVPSKDTGATGNTTVDGLGVDLLLKETDAAIYAWDPNIDENIVDEPGVPLLPGSTSVGQVTNLQLQSDQTTEIVRGDGIAHSQINATWTQVSDAMVANGGSIEVWLQAIAPNGVINNPQSSGRTTGVAPGFYLYKRVGGADTSVLISPINDGWTYNVMMICVNSHGVEGVGVTATVGASTAPSVLSMDFIVDGVTYTRSSQLTQTVSLDNPSFEVSDQLPANAPPNWVNNGATISYETGAPQSGTRSVKIQANQAFGGLFQNKVYKVEPGEMYKVQGWLHSDGGAFANIEFQFRDKNGAYVGSVDAGTTSGTWTFVKSTGIVPAGAVAAIFFVGSWPH